jgi:hypothetical protein
LISHIIANEKKSSLSFYVAFLDGMRKVLCPEIREASCRFWDRNEWSIIEDARVSCRKNNEEIAAKLEEMCQRLEKGTAEKVKAWADREILIPLGLDVPDQGVETS